MRSRRAPEISAGEIAEYEWTARATVDAVSNASEDVAISATCRGSAHPGALGWLIDRLVPTVGPWLDVGAGLGGPSAFLARRTGLRPVLIEQADASAAGVARLHGLPVARADATQLPIRDRTCATAWALGVLSATHDPGAVLAAIGRAVIGGGRLGLLEYVSTTQRVSDPMSGNTFLTRDALVATASPFGWHTIDDVPVEALGAPPEAWTREQSEIERDIRHRNPTSDVLRRSQAREEHIGRLIADATIAPHLFVLELRHDQP